jgi:hypothetical protein
MSSVEAQLSGKVRKFENFAVMKSHGISLRNAKSGNQ